MKFVSRVSTILMYFIELQLRFPQAGAYQPFFRAHAHLDTRRREPWLLPEENMRVIREAVRARYALLPYWYTLFYNAETSGSPIMKPLWVDFPADKSIFPVDDEHLVGQCHEKCHLVRSIVVKIYNCSYVENYRNWYVIIQIDSCVWYKHFSSFSCFNIINRHATHWKEGDARMHSIGLYRDVCIAAIAWSRMSLETQTVVMWTTSQCKVRSLRANSGMWNVICIVTYTAYHQMGL